MEFKELLRNKKVLIASFVFIAMSIFVIFMAILQNTKKDTPNSSNIETDPASGQKIAFTGYTPTNGDGIIWVGYEELKERGVSSSMNDNIKKIIREYAKYDWKKDLKRVSLYKNSYKNIREKNELQMKFALNINEKDIYVKVISKSVENYDIKIYSDSNHSSEIKTLNYCSVLICKPEIPQNNGVDSNYAG